jgi:hypothetical protein
MSRTKRKLIKRNKIRRIRTDHDTKTTIRKKILDEYFKEKENRLQ